MNNNKINIKFKKNYKEVPLNNETIKNYNQDLNRIFNKLKNTQAKIKKCSTLDDLTKHDLSNLSNELSLVIQNSIIIENIDLKKRIEEINQSYRDTELLFFNKKIELLNNKIMSTFEKTEANLEHMTSNTLFGITSVFLGISLTSALVIGVQYVGKEFLFLYFMTCLLIAVITIGLTSIFLRKFDNKSQVILVIIFLISFLWLIIGFFSYKLYINNMDDNNEKINISSEKELSFDNVCDKKTN